MLEQEWKNIGRGRLLMSHPDLFFVIKPDTESDAVPFSCSVCEFPMRTADDNHSFKAYGCCHLCTLRWAESRKADWIAGWRPSEEQVTDEIATRLCRVPKLSI